MTDQSTRDDVNTRELGENAGTVRCNTPRGVFQRTPTFHDTPWGRLRAERGWSLRDLAERSGVNIADLSRIERAMLAVSPDQARAILGAYDEPTVDWLADALAEVVPWSAWDDHKGWVQLDGTTPRDMAEAVLAFQRAAK